MAKKVSRNLIPQCRSHTIAPFIRFLEEIGSPTQKLLEEVKFPLLALENPEALIPRYQVFMFLEKVAKREGIENLGLVVGQQTKIENLGAFGRVVGQALTLYDALNRIIHLIPITNTGVGYVLKEQQEQVWFYHQLMKLDDSNFKHGSYFVLMLVIQLIQQAAGSQWRPQEIQLQTHQAPDLTNIPTLAEAKIHLNQKATGIAFPRSFLSLPFTSVFNAPNGQSQQNYKLLHSSAPAQDFLGSLRQIITTLLPEGYPKIELLAEISNMSVRTFQRQLIEEGFTYSSLVEQVRFETAVRLLLDSSLQIVDIASQLGYTDVAHFTRAFKRWSGVSPSAFRFRN